MSRYERLTGKDGIGMRPQRGQNSYLEFLTWAITAKKALPTQGELLKYLHQSLDKSAIEPANGRAIGELLSVFLPSAVIFALLYLDEVQQSLFATVALIFLQSIQLYRLSSLVHDMIHR